MTATDRGRRPARFLAALLFTLAVVHPAAAGVYKICDFEEGSIAAEETGADTAGSHSVYAVSDPVRAGSWAARFELRVDDPLTANGFRSELTLEPDTMDTERWYGFSVWLPAGFTADRVPTIVAQWHGIPDYDRGEGYRHPPLRLRRKRDRWEITICSDDRPVVEIGDHRIDEMLRLGPVEEEAWTDWIFHIRWSTGDDGFVRACRNGEEVASYGGPVGFDDFAGPYLKFGIYKPAWKDPERVRIHRWLYYDEIRAGDETCGYDDVAPGR